MNKSVFNDSSNSDGESKDKEAINNFENRSEEAQEIITSKPGFTERWALFIFFAILLLLLIASWNIRYPNIIHAKAIIISDIEPRDIIPFESGRLSKLFVKDGQEVHKEDTLGLIEKSITSGKYLKLSLQLDSIIKSLGQQQAQKAIYSFLNSAHALGLSHFTYDRLIILCSEICSSNMDVVKLTNALYMLRDSVVNWEKNYVVTAPSDGRLLLSNNFHLNSYVEQDIPIGSIQPLNNIFFAKMYVPQSTLGKVNTDMKVQFHLDAFPYNEYGTVSGKISYISTEISDSGCLVYVTINNRLLTNTGKIILYRSGLRADGLIMQSNYRLLQQLYYNIIKPAKR